MDKTLYKLDSKGKIRSWEIVVTHEATYTRTIIRTGLLDGAKVETETFLEEGKNFGKSNETTHYDQALLEADSKIRSQLKKGYVDDIVNIKSKDLLGSGIPAPMLANKHHPTGDQKGSKTLFQMGILGKHIAVQPKLDGNRCMIKVEKGYATMYTRSGDIMPVQLEHIIEDVNEISFKTLSDDFILDGELFSDKIPFNKLNGLIKRETVSEEDIKERQNIKFHLYDAMLESGYEYRYEFIQQFQSVNIEVIPSFVITATDENIKKYLEQFLAEGHEGLMIRQLDMPYDHKRSWQLCKVKVFEDSEFTLIGFEKEKRGEFVGAFIMSDGEHTFNAGASGQSEEERSYIWYHQDEFIEKQATVCYFGLSEYGIPRFPKFKGLK